jgi:hypothetical protein
MKLETLTLNGKTYDKFPADRTRGLILPAEITGNAASTISVPVSLISFPLSGYKPSIGDMVLTLDNCLYKITGFTVGEETEYTGKLIRTLSSGSSPNAEDGGYYAPSVSQVDENTMKVSFTASKEGMAEVTDKDITLPAGKDGADGYTPVRGTDYWTEADKASMIQDVIDALGGSPVFGVVDADNNIVLTGNLADGTYTLKYEDDDGTVTEIGTVTVGEVMPDSGEVELVWTQTKLDKTTGAEGDGSGYYASQHIDLVDGYAYTASQVKDAGSGNTTGAISICYYDANGGYLGYEELWATSGNEQSKVLTPLENAATFRIRLYAGTIIEERYHVTFEKTA